jgi:hypothetical protein
MVLKNKMRKKLIQMGKVKRMIAFQKAKIIKIIIYLLWWRV